MMITVYRRLIVLQIIGLMLLAPLAVAQEPLLGTPPALSVAPIRFETVNWRKNKSAPEQAQAQAEKLSSLSECPNGCLALLVFGKKQADFIQAVEKAVSEAVTAGVPIKALIYGNAVSAKQTVNGLKTTTGNALIFYAAGTATSLFVNIRDNDSDAVFNLCQDEIRRAYTLMADMLKGIEPPPEPQPTSP